MYLKKINLYFLQSTHRNGACSHSCLITTAIQTIAKNGGAIHAKIKKCTYFCQDIQVKNQIEEKEKLFL